MRRQQSTKRRELISRVHVGSCPFSGLGRDYKLVIDVWNSCAEETTDGIHHCLETWVAEYSYGFLARPVRNVGKWVRRVERAITAATSTYVRVA